MSTRRILSPAHVEELRGIFAYDPLSGVVSRVAGRRIGPVGTPTIYGYLKVSQTLSDGTRPVLLVHRLAFLLATGEQPLEVDHEDTDRANNKLSNLRAATREQNGQNRRKKGSNSTRSSDLPTGVYRLVRKDGRATSYRAQTSRGPNALKRQTFPTLEQALEARRQWADQDYGSFSPSRSSALSPTI